MHRARLIGRVAPTTGIAPFAELVDQVMTSEPYASARRVFWIVDNGSSHRGQRSIDRLRGVAHPDLVHLPIHASWLNQIEIYFSVVQRKVLNPNDFADLDALAARLTAFERPLQRHRDPVRLALHPHRSTRMLDRLDAHRTGDLTPATGSLNPGDDARCPSRPRRPRPACSSA